MPVPGPLWCVWLELVSSEFPALRACVSHLGHVIDRCNRDTKHTSGSSDGWQMCVGASLCRVSVADVLYTLSFEYVAASCVRC